MRLILNFTVPNLPGPLFQQLYNMVDAVIAAGAAYLSAGSAR